MPAYNFVQVHPVDVKRIFNRPIRQWTKEYIELWCIQMTLVPWLFIQHLSSCLSLMCMRPLNLLSYTFLQCFCPMSPCWKGAHVAQVLSVRQHPVLLDPYHLYVYNPSALLSIACLAVLEEETLLCCSFGEVFPNLNREKEGVICTDWKSPLRRIYNIGLYKWRWLDFTAKI